MALFAIGDTHLSFGTDKPMDIFGGWNNYTERLENGWRGVVGEDDTVVVCGDISWAMKLESTGPDFSFLHSLPGKKLILKGNHDYWWTTKRKMDNFIEENGFSSLSILFNNCFEYNGVYLCGTRGWSYDCPQSEQTVLLREVGRLRLSLDSAPKDSEKIVFLHYPPVYGDYRCDEIMQVLHEYEIKTCYYAHLHGGAHKNAVIGEYEGIRMHLCAGDHCSFTPMLIMR